MEEREVLPGHAHDRSAHPVRSGRPVVALVRQTELDEQRDVRVVQPVVHKLSGTAGGHQPQGTDKEIDATFTAEWNAVSSPNSGIFDPDQGLLHFPLRPGDTHEARYDVRFPRQGAYEVKQDRRVTVVGWEDVKVPAGTFHALRVESEGSFYRIDLNVRGQVKEVMWYAPQAKRYVKWSYDNWTGRRSLQSWAWELLDYHVQ